MLNVVSIETKFLKPLYIHRPVAAVFEISNPFLNSQWKAGNHIDRYKKLL